MRDAHRMVRASLFVNLLVGVLGPASVAPNVQPAYEDRRPEVGLVGVAPAESLHVWRDGTPAADRPLVVLVTGPMGSSFSMRRIAQALIARGHAVLVVDPLGMGASTRPANADYALSHQAVRVQRLIDRTVAHDVPLLMVGQGTSATIALHVAASEPSRVRGVVSIAGGGVDRQATSGLRFATALAPLLNTPIGRAIGRRRFAAAARAQSADPSWATDSVLAAYLVPIERDLRATLRAYSAMQQASEPLPITRRLASIDVQVRLIIGDKPLDNAPTEAQIQALRTALRDFRVDTVRAAGTMLQEERAPDVARIIDDMVRRHAGPTRTQQLELPL